jgi:hypothetical protein
MQLGLVVSIQKLFEQYLFLCANEISLKLVIQVAFIPRVIRVKCDAPHVADLAR